MNPYFPTSWLHVHGFLGQNLKRLDFEVIAGYLEKRISVYQSVLNCGKVLRDINTKISPVVNLYENPLCTKNQGHWCPKFGFPAKNV